MRSLAKSTIVYQCVYESTQQQTSSNILISPFYRIYLVIVFSRSLRYTELIDGGYRLINLRSSYSQSSPQSDYCGARPLCSRGSIIGLNRLHLLR